MNPVRSQDLIDRHDLILIDAYGVLVTSQGALPGAQAFISELQKRGREYFILTNDASRLPETAAAFYARCGLAIPVDRVLTAGLAIEEAFSRHQLSSPRCAVLGTPDTHAYVKRAGGTSIEIRDDSSVDAVVVGDDSGFDVIPTLNALLSSLHKQVLDGQTPRLLLANPDFLYPRGNQSFGFTSGSLAKLLELGLSQLHPDKGLAFEVLGKPSRLLFEMALNRSGLKAEQAVMLGDQLHTDIKGANRAGIASTLVRTGVTHGALSAHLTSLSEPENRPTYLLDSL